MNQMSNETPSAPQETLDLNGEMAAEQLAAAAEKIKSIRDEVQKVIVGQNQVVEEVLITLLSSGHALLVGVPGLAKTLLVETLGTVLGLSEKRVQFTPDLLPADILGSEVLEEGDGGKRSFRFIKGPIFCQLLMADEINRASPRTQSALLQAMQEKTVTISGKTHTLDQPFHVLATQNPIEQEGTYPLPEAQLDRFFAQVNVDYPTEAEEREILIRTTGLSEQKPKAVIDRDGLAFLQHVVRAMPVSDKVIDAILGLVRSARPQDEHSPLSWGPGPRAAQSLMLGCRARALIAGRMAPSVDDVIALAKPVLRHRIALKFSARADGLTIDDYIDGLTSTL